MTKSFFSTDPNVHQSENTWFTPKPIIDALGGAFDLDPCTLSSRPFDTARFHVEHDKGHCGLALKWEGCVWMNPPYGKEIAPFIKKFKDHKNGVALVFARMGTAWMQDWISSGGSVFFLRKRVRFVDKSHKQSTTAGTDSCFLFAGQEALRRILNSNLEGVLTVGRL